MVTTTFRENLTKEKRKNNTYVVLFKGKVIAYCDDRSDADYFINLLLKEMTHNE